MLKNSAKLLSVPVILAAGVFTSVTIGSAAANKTMAQKLVEEIKAGHPEISSLELAAARSKSQACRTIAATESKEIGQKCDQDELTAMKTNQPFMEREKDGFDVTVPIHDSAGNVIGTVGMDFTPAPGQTQETVTDQARKIASELEKRVTSRDQLFEPAK